MNEQKDEKWLDELIAGNIDTSEPKFDAEKWKQKYPDEFQTLLSRAAKGAAGDQPNIWRIISKTSIPKFAGAAVLVIGLAIGVLMGRNTWQSPGIRSVGKSQMVQVGPTTIYNLDYLTEAPKGSLADAYLTLVSTTNGKER